MRLLVYLSKLNYWDLNAKVNFLKHTLLLLTTTLKLNMSKNHSKYGLPCKRHAQSPKLKAGFNFNPFHLLQHYTGSVIRLLIPPNPFISYVSTVHSLTNS